ncbi:heme ABC transporter ATP-binding protein [Deinococcus metallilatus]|uniref:Iron complex transport system ATP-binding protein n=1 Tax=Deinococcus metallilatus TaxID=1211322 RepID=A0ABR6MRS5_9DEIO|nr:heme ABC transporter ATP-binding protein [Deinococcus metallilatus]MBB5294614.1 iron complex transport system ATP-binding protein [Deinococcus metallilatus]GMA15827.1 hemin import ATP-binding protein HmuV [Deinococcus metallilatus]
MRGFARKEIPTPPPGAPLVEVADLNYSVSGRELLRNISFGLTGGEMLAVLGRNGAGKSTLLKHLTGELGKDGVRMFGQTLREHAPADLARRRAALPQQTPMTFAYEVLDVVLLGRIPHGRRETEEDRAVARAALEQVGLAGFEHRNILTLSGGEQQRVHLARVLAQLWPNPATDRPERVLLLDEPTSSLDLAHQHATLRLARALCAEGVGVIAVLHDLNLAAQYADRVLIVSGGRVTALGTPEEVLTPAVIEEAFGHRVAVTPHPCLKCPLIVSAQ